MADNLTTTTTVSTVPNATVIATDDAGSAHYQKVKLVDGTADSTTVIPGTANGLQVVTAATVIDLTLSLDTDAYADGDVLAATQELASAVRASGTTGVIQSIGFIDDDDQGQALDIVILDSDVALGSENAAVSIADGDADNILGIVRVAAGDYIDLVGSQWAQPSFDPIVVKPVTGTSLYVAVISRGTGTYSASGITIRFGIVQD